MHIFQTRYGTCWTEIYGYGNPFDSEFPWYWWLPCGNGLWHLVPAL